MFARKPFRRIARRLGLFVEQLEHRLAPARGISPTEVLAQIDAVNPLGVLHRELASGRLIGVDLDSSKLIGPGFVQIGLHAGTDPEAVVSELSITPKVRAAQPNYVYTVRTEAEDFTPNDKQFANQWSLTKMQLPSAWGILNEAKLPLGNNNTVVAVIDDGLAVNGAGNLPLHSDMTNGPGLTSALAKNAFEIANSEDDDNNGIIDDLYGWDFTDNNADTSPGDGQFHGNSVAGIIAARTHNFDEIANSSTIAGIAGGKYDATLDQGKGDQIGGVSILPVRVIYPDAKDPGINLTDSAKIVAGLNFVASRNVRIANMSFDLDQYAADSMVQAALTNAYDAGVLLIGSAGNTQLVDPARGILNQVLFVAGTNETDERWTDSLSGRGSAYGSFVDISAPAANIVVHSIPSTTGTDSGTSYAAPAVAGVAALLLAQDSSLTRDQLAARLMGTAVDIYGIAANQKHFAKNQLGAGRVDAKNALDTKIKIAVPTIKSITSSGVTITNGATLTSLTEITLDVPLRFNPASVNAASFELRTNGKDNIWGNTDDAIIPLSVSPYRIGSNSVTISLPGDLKSERYRFTAKSGLPYLRDPFNTPLNGTPGLNEVREFDLAAAERMGGFPDWTQQADSLGGGGEGGRVRVFPDGSFVMTWARIGVDGSGRAIMARLYDRYGQAKSGEFLVNSTTAGDQFGANAALFDDGSFVITWSSGPAVNSGNSIYAQRFDKDGTRIGTEITVSAPNGSQQWPDAEALPGEKFIVVWGSNTDASDPDGAILASVYDMKTGANLKSTFRVNTTIANPAQFPSIGVSPTGQCVAVWQNNGYQLGRVFDAINTSSTMDFSFGPIGVGFAEPSRPSFDAKGNFVTSFHSTFGTNGVTYDIYAQRFNSTGGLLDALPVNVGPSNDTNIAAVTDANGNVTSFFMVYDANTNSNLVYSRRYGSNGLALEPAALLASPGAGGYVIYGSAGIADNGSTVVAWSRSNGESYFARTSGIAQLASIRVTGDANPITAGERVVQNVGSLTASFTRPLSGTVSAKDQNDYYANWQIRVDGFVNGPGEQHKITSIAAANGGLPVNGLYDYVVKLANPVLSGTVELTARDAIQDEYGNGLDGGIFPVEPDNKFGGDHVVSFSVASIGPRGNLLQVNPLAAGNQSSSDVDVNDAGQAVVVWTDLEPDSSMGIYGQRYTNAGLDPAGKFHISDTLNTSDQFIPKVSIHQDGSFVVAWMSNDLDGPSDAGIQARRYKADGTAMPIIHVNNQSGYTALTQQRPDVEMLADGSFVVVWDGFGPQDPSGVYARRFTSLDAPSDITFVNASTATGVFEHEQGVPSIASDAQGNYVIVWTDKVSEGNNTYGIRGRQYRSNGTALNDTIATINTTTSGNQLGGMVAVAGNGQIIVTWQSDSNTKDGSDLGAIGRVFNSAFVPLSDEILLAQNTDSNQIYPTVAADADGDFIATWYSNDSKANGYDVSFRRFNSLGQPVGDEFRISSDASELSGNQEEPRVSLNSQGDGYLTYYGAGKNDPNGVFVRRIGGNDSLSITGKIDGDNVLQLLEDAGTTVVNINIFSDPGNSTATFDYTVTNNISNAPFTFMIDSNAKTMTVTTKADATGSASITLRATAKGSGLYTEEKFAVIVQPVNDPPYFEKGADVISVINSNAISIPNWAKGKANKEGTETDTVSYEILSNSNPALFSVQPALASNGTLSFTQVPGTYGSATLTVRAKDNGGTANGGKDFSEPQSFVITVDPTNPNYRAGSPTVLVNPAASFMDAQFNPAITSNPNGASAVAWMEGATNPDVYVRMYGATGTPTAAVKAGTIHNGDQNNPSVAMLADGTVLVAWESNAGGDYEIKGRLFAMDGTPISKDEFTINVPRSDSQSLVRVASGGSGFVAVWQSGQGQDGDDLGVFGRRINLTGAYGPEIAINAETAGAQHLPDVTVDNLGNFTATWQVVNQPGLTGYDIRARRFNSLDIGGAEVSVNTTSIGDQFTPRIAGDADGDVVVVWYDAVSADVKFQRFNANLGKVGPETTAHASSTAGTQNDPSVSMDADGDFTIAFSGEGASDPSGAYFQRFDRDGSMLGSLSRINPATAGTQQQVRVAVDADGDAFFTWAGDGTGISDNNNQPVTGTQEIFWRRHGQVIGLTTQSPEAFDSGAPIDLGGFFIISSGPTEALGFTLGTGGANSLSLSGRTVSGRNLNLLYKETAFFGGTETNITPQNVAESNGNTTKFVVWRLQDKTTSPRLAFIRDREVNEGQVINFTAFAQDNKDSANIVYSIIANPQIGAKAPYIGPGVIDSKTGIYTLATNDDLNEYVTIRATDPDNGYYTQETLRLTARNVAPTAPVGALSGNMGNVVPPNATPTFTVSGATDKSPIDQATLRYAFDFDNDGRWDVGGVSIPANDPNFANDRKVVTWASASKSNSVMAPASFFAAAGTVRIVRAMVIDEEGGQYSEMTYSVNVENVGGSASPPTAVITVNGGGNQRSNVTKITVAFDQPVTFPADYNGAFTLTRAGSPGIVPLNFNQVGNLLTITFAAPFVETTIAEPSLIDGIYTLTVNAPFIQGLYGPLQSLAPIIFKRLFGDSNGDATVDASDFANFGNTFGSTVGALNYDSTFDINADGTIDANDFAAFGNRFGLTL